MSIGIPFGRSLGSRERSFGALFACSVKCRSGIIALSSSSLRRLITAFPAGGQNVGPVFGFFAEGPAAELSLVLLSFVGDFSMLRTAELPGAVVFLCGDCEAARKRALDSWSDLPRAGLEMAALSAACQELALDHWGIYLR